MASRAAGGGVRTRQAVIAPPPLFAPEDQTGLGQQVHVFGDGGGRQADQFDQLTQAKFALTQQEQGARAGFVAEGLGDVKESLDVRVTPHFYTSPQSE